MEEILDSKRVYDGKMVQVDAVNVALSDGSTSEREVVRRTPGVCIVMLRQRGDEVRQGVEVMLIQQFRVPAEKELLEIVAGMIDEGETPLESAKRELREETGYEADEWAELGTFYASPGYTDEQLTLFLARDGHYVGDDPDDTEDLNIRTIPFTLALEEVRKGKIQDLKTVAGLLWAAAYLESEM